MVADEFLAKDNGASTYQTFWKKNKNMQTSRAGWHSDVLYLMREWPSNKNKNTIVYDINLKHVYFFGRDSTFTKNNFEKFNDSAGKSGEEQGS